MPTSRGPSVDLRNNIADAHLLKQLYSVYQKLKRGKSPATSTTIAWSLRDDHYWTGLIRIWCFRDGCCEGSHCGGFREHRARKAPLLTLWLHSAPGTGNLIRVHVVMKKEDYMRLTELRSGTWKLGVAKLIAIIAPHLCLLGMGGSIGSVLPTVGGCNGVVTMS